MSKIKQADIDRLIERLQDQTARLPWKDALDRYRETGDPAPRAEIERARIRHFFGDDGFRRQG